MSVNLASESWSALCLRVARSKGPVAWRWAVTRDNSGVWRLASLVVSVGEAVEPFRLRYPSAILVGEQLQPRTAASRLRRGIVSRKATVPDGVQFSVPQQTTPQRLYSCDEYLFVPHGWPCVFVSLSASDGGYLELQQPLHSGGQPQFPSLATALAERVFGVSPSELRRGQVSQVLVCIPDRRARIATVDVHEGKVRVEVESCEPARVAGFVLRAMWRAESESVEWERHDHVLRKPEAVALETAGSPAAISLVLVDPDGKEIDRRAWDEQFGRPIEEPGSLDERVARWLSEGEHVQLEYKQTLKNAKARTSFAETVAAFANGVGGVVLVGVGEEANPVGYGAAKAADDIANILSELVKELPKFTVDEVRVEDRPIAVVMVASSASDEKPHQVKSRVMIRVAATTRPATPAQVRQLTGGEVSEIPGGIWRR